MVVVPKLNLPLASVSVNVTLLVIKRPVIWSFLTAGALVDVEKVSELVLTVNDGVAACAVPLMLTVLLGAPELVRVSVAVVLPAAVGA